MNTKQRRATHRNTGRTTEKAIGRGADPVSLPTPASEMEPDHDEAQTVGPGTYEVPLDVVTTNQSAGPAQIPWLAEIRAKQPLNDSFSGVI